jgi:sugar-specific transcriptional regulator TrmB
MTDAEEINKEIIEHHKDSPMIQDQMAQVLKDLERKVVLDLRVDNITDHVLKHLVLKMALDRKAAQITDHVLKDLVLKMVLDRKVAQDHRVDNITDLVQVEKILLVTTHKKKTSNSRSFFYLKGAS